MKSFLIDSPFEIRTDATDHQLTLERTWTGDHCKLVLCNTGPESVHVNEVIAFRTDLPFHADTPVYGEAYNKLTQYTGTLETVSSITNYSDAGHYKLPQPEGLQTVYNLLLLYPPNQTVLFGFTSCHKFNGCFRFKPGFLEVVIDCEGLSLPAGERWSLEEFCFLQGPNRDDLLETFGNRIAQNHPPLPSPEIPTGWCSWYAYGPAMTEQDIFNNMAAIRDRIPGLKYIQIDDGYQKHMGDWLQQHPNFPSPITELCHRIADEGLEPAIWVAPFIAEADSDLLRDHPEWFVKDDEGKPLPSDRDSFGGWRYGPWYMLDGTHPGACDYLRHVFATMRKEWKCRYFKLDANMWGALPFGHRHDSTKTKVEAYRMGMQAILDGAGEDSFILGCNAPMWPSIGTVHGMRTTGDINRRWPTFKVLSEETFHRNWQNRKLWLNDPDCLVVANQEEKIMGPDGTPVKGMTSITEDEFSFHMATILASGGMILSSDKMPELTDEHIRLIEMFIPANGAAAKFDDRSFQIGRSETSDRTLLFLFNSSDARLELTAELPPHQGLQDYWSGAAVEADTDSFHAILPPRSARVLTILA